MDFTSIFDGIALTLEQFQEKTKAMKLADLATGDYVSKGKYDDDLKKVRGELETAKGTIADLEKNKQDADALQKTIDEYKEADEKRQKEEQAAREKADMEARFNAALGEKEFSSDFAREGVFARFSAALADPANKGKGDNELFAALTKDVEGIFKSQKPAVNMGGVKWNSDPATDSMSDADYYASIFKKG